MAKSFQTEFVDYYKDKLAAKGFVKVKGRQPYFVRVVNDEILHVITYMTDASTDIRYKKAFELACAVATVYKKKINFSVSPNNNDNWPQYQTDIEKMKETWYHDISKRDILRKIHYNDDTIQDALEETEEGMKVLLEVLDRVTDMDEVARFLVRYNLHEFRFNHLLDDNQNDQECLYYCRKEYDFSIFDKMGYEMIDEIKRLRNTDYILYEDEKDVQKWIESNNNKRKAFINNPEAYEKGMELLKQNYERNLEVLQNYGIEISRHAFL